MCSLGRCRSGITDRGRHPCRPADRGRRAALALSAPVDSLFFYGTPAASAAAGAGAGRCARRAIVAGARCRIMRFTGPRGEAFPLIVAQPGAVAQGLLVEGLTRSDVARLDFYEGGFDYALRPVTVTTDDGQRGALVYFPEPGRWPVGEPWSLRRLGRGTGRAISLRRRARGRWTQFGHDRPRRTGALATADPVARGLVGARRRARPRRRRYGTDSPRAMSRSKAAAGRIAGSSRWKSRRCGFAASTAR